MKDKFKKEIERLIFDYILEEEKLKEETLENLVNKLMKKKTEEFKGNINKLNQINLEIEELSEKIEEQNNYLDDNKIEETIKFEMNIDYKTIRNLKANITNEISLIKKEVSTIDDNELDGSLIKSLKEKEYKAKNIIDDLSHEQVKYQNYLLDMNKWVEKLRV